ncbi:DUF6270 domain-containing protein [Lysobacter sp. F6437]|uniref:DUF6270 domain-containing protein n=1 Tax=Lysobacter sp. F6437 TaxID=3459296 RepID=UPI00403DA3CF
MNDPMESANHHVKQEAGPLHVIAQSDGRMLHIKASLDGVQADAGTFEYAFYVHSGRERIATRWYKPASTFIHHEIDDLPATRVTAFVRDGAGRMLPPIRVNVTAAKSVYVFGSCVSRDAFEIAPRQDAILAGYLARSSLASAFDHRRPSPALSAHLERLPSRWQRNMVANDLGRRAPGLLAKAHFDALLLDLVDERFALLDVGGTLVTASVEFRGTGYPVRKEDLIRPGSNRHLNAWKLGVDSLLALAGPGRVIVNRVFWATHDDVGDELPDQPRIERHNLVLTDMYAYLDAKAGLRFIRYPEELLVADSGHKWGRAPFHYVADMYRHTMAELLRAI